jgi:phenylacetate-CoA ligase
VRPTIAAASAVVPSGFLKTVFAKYGIGAEVVPNIVDMGRFYPGGAMHVGPHLVVTRNLEALYDIPTAIRAFVHVRARHPKARLTIAGSGPCREALERLCAELGVSESVTFSGRLDNERVAELYRTADLLLNPSRVDNMPISLLEALASGVPIVSTDVGGVPYLVEDGKTALLVPAGDPDAMGNAALRVLGDAARKSLRWPGLRPRVSTPGRASARGSSRPTRGPFQPSRPMSTNPRREAVMPRVVHTAPSGTKPAPGLYTRFVSSVLFPLHEWAKGLDTVAVRRDLERTQWLGRRELEALQLEHLRALLLRHAAVVYPTIATSSGRPDSTRRASTPSRRLSGFRFSRRTLFAAKATG